MIIGESPEDRSERLVDEGYRFRKSRQDGVYYDEFMRPIPLVGGICPDTAEQKEAGEADNEKTTM